MYNTDPELKDTYLQYFGMPPARTYVHYPHTCMHACMSASTQIHTNKQHTNIRTNTKTHRKTHKHMQIDRYRL